MGPGIAIQTIVKCELGREVMYGEEFMTFNSTGVLVLFCAFISAGSAMAKSITFTASDATRSASAIFSIKDDTLQVMLSNTSMEDVLVPTDVLTALFFQTGDSTLKKMSAVLGPGSSILYDPTSSGNDVGGEWAYRSGIGVSSTGLGEFGQSDRFSTTDLTGQDSLGGLAYGILSMGDDPRTQAAGGGDKGDKDKKNKNKKDNTSDHGPILGSGGLIRNSVVFTFGVDSKFKLEDVSHVRFLYGTSLDEPIIPGTCTDCTPVPEPASLLQLGAGLTLLGLAFRKMKAGRSSHK